MDFAVPVDHTVKIKVNEKRHKYLNLARKQKTKYEDDGYTHCNRCTWNDPQKLETGTGRDRNMRTSRDYLNYCIKIEQDTEKNPRDLKRLIVTQNPLKNHQITLV